MPRLLFLYLILIAAVGAAVPPERAHRLEHKSESVHNGKPPPYFLTVCAQFKDEDDILVEWVEHYINEGVEHFLLIDDGSSDTSHKVLKPFISEGLITLMVDDRKQHNPPISMVERYNLLFRPFYYLTTWMVHVDLDEFVYARRTTLTTYLRHVASDVGEIRVPWKLFGSSGHIKKPLVPMIESLTGRHNFSVASMMHIHTKPIFRVSACVREDAHWVELKPGYRSGFPLANGLVGPILPGWPLSATDNMPEWDSMTDEQILNQLAVHLNHYAIRWRDWYMDVKVSRGIADRDVSVYDEAYFNGFDRNDVVDLELAEKSRTHVHRLLISR